MSTDVLSAAGYGRLTARQAAGLLADFNSALEAVVGYRLAKGLSDEDMDEFADLIDENDGDAALAWIERQRPGYRDTVQETYAEMLADLKRIASTTDTNGDGAD